MGFNYTMDESFQMGTNSRERKLDEIERRLVVVEKKLASNVIEVVRCKDCKYHGATIEEQPTPSIMCVHMHDNDYCSYGERREK